MDADDEVLQPDPPFWTKTSWLQLGYGLWVNMTVLGIGLLFGFPAVTIPQLKQPDSTVKVTLADEAWIVSILTLSSPLGSLMCGILMDKYGRRLVLVLCAIPICFGWFYTGFAQTAMDIIIGRVVAGVGLGMAMTAPRAYISEITLPNMRGVIGALPNLAISIGLTLQAGFGSLLKWYILCYICGGYTFITLISNIFLPDTPHYLLLKSSPTNARINLRRFRSSKFNVDAEIDDLYEFKAVNNIRSLTCKEQIKALFKPSSCKPYGITTIYVCFMQLSGVNVVIMWVVEILELANSSLDSNLGNFILGLTRIVFGILTSILLFKVGRRVLALVSAVGVGVMAIGLCAYLYTSGTEKSILPQLIFMAYIGFATLGYYTIPILMMFELLPLQVRGLLSGICLAQLNLMMFGMNNAYPFMMQYMGLANMMAMFGIFSLIGAIVLYFILPETKGLTLQEIEEYFNARRSTLVSQRQVMSMQLREASRGTLSGPMSNANLKTTMKATDKKHRDLKEREHIKDKIIRDSPDTSDSKNKYSYNKKKHTEDNVFGIEKQIDKDEDIENKQTGDKDSKKTSLKVKISSTVVRNENVESNAKEFKVEDTEKGKIYDPKEGKSTDKDSKDGNSLDKDNGNPREGKSTDNDSKDGNSVDKDNDSKEGKSTDKNAKDPNLKNKKNSTVNFKDTNEDD